MALPAAITLFKLVLFSVLLYVTTASVYVFSRALRASSVWIWPCPLLLMREYEPR